MHAPTDPTVQLTCDNCGYKTNRDTPGRAQKYLNVHSCERQIEKRAKAERGALRGTLAGEERPCTHDVHHEHGSIARYTRDGCRCRPCRDSQVAYYRRRARGVAYGTWDAFTDATPIRDHAKALQASGMGAVAIALASGVGVGTIRSLLETRGGRTRTSKVRTESARLILAVTKPQPMGGSAVPAIGTTRRLQALQRCGWPIAWIAREAGRHEVRLCMIVDGQPTTTAATARAVAAAYDRLWNTPPPVVTARDQGAVTRALKGAADRGWMPPLAWDDDSIDDPNARPQIGEPEAPTRVHIEDVEELALQGYTSEQIAARFGVTTGGVDRAVTRRGTPELRDLLRRNRANAA